MLKDIQIGLPEIQKAEIHVPGMMGMLDLSESQYGGVKFKNRKLAFVFDARYCSFSSWPELVNTVASHLHGKKLKIALDIDDGYFYAGRCTLETRKENEIHSEISVKCDCYPLKMSLRRPGSDWGPRSPYPTVVSVATAHQSPEKAFANWSGWASCSA